MVDAEAVAQQQLDLGRVLELADLMLRKAERQQWAEVAKLQSLRDRLIHEFFAKELAMDSAQVAESIKAIIGSDKRLERLMSEERRVLQAEIQKMKQGKNAVKAYSVK